MNNYLEQFRDAMVKTGITPPELIEPNGKINRFATNGKPNDEAGWYLLYSDGIPAGCFGDWRTGIKHDWKADTGRSLSLAEEAEHRARIKQIHAQREVEETVRRAEAQNKATAIWKKAEPAADNHPYLLKKRVKANGVKIYKDALVIPLRDEHHTLHSLQFIDAKGEKRFLTGGRIAGCYFGIGTVKNAPALCVSEGLVTAKTIYEATGYPVAVAFNANNLLAVSQIMRKKLPHLPIVLCLDDDYQTQGNPGLRKATEAAQAISGLLAAPNFDEDRPSNATDFNDMQLLYGLESVKKIITSVLNGWEPPLPLISKIAPEAYPIDALPKTIREAVIEVQNFTKAPIPLVVTSALGVLSLAGQSYVDIMRAENLCGPTGLFLITIADSGERKSSCDGFFIKPIRDYEAAEIQKAKPLIKIYDAKLAAWISKHSGIKTKIRKLVCDDGKAEEIQRLESKLLELENSKPQPPKVPRLIYSDVTPEALKSRFATVWPSAGIISSEGGIVFGAHGMQKDSAMRNLATYNQGWDGKGIPTDRLISESNNTQEVRLTMAIQVQAETLREFSQRLGPLARGIGYFARVLFAWPDSTQGTRFFTEPPKHWPSLTKFHQRIEWILNTPPPFNSTGELTPTLMSLAELAKIAWVRFHDEIEKELHSSGELYDISDVASKSADNVARLATLFHLIEHGPYGEVEEESVNRASLVMLWHLKESQRFFGEISLSPELLAVNRLDAWLIAYCKRENTNQVPMQAVQQRGPSKLRKKEVINTALNELQELNRARLKVDGKHTVIEVNPALINEEIEV